MKAHCNLSETKISVFVHVYVCACVIHLIFKWDK